MSWSQQLSNHIIPESSLIHFGTTDRDIYRHAFLRADKHIIYTTLKINPNNAMDTAATGQKPLGFKESLWKKP